MWWMLFVCVGLNKTLFLVSSRHSVIVKCKFTFRKTECVNVKSLVVPFKGLYTGHVANKQRENTNYSDATYSDQNSSHWQRHEFVTDTQEHEFAKEF